MIQTKSANPAASAAEFHAPPSIGLTWRDTYNGDEGAAGNGLMLPSLLCRVNYRGEYLKIDKITRGGGMGHKKKQQPLQWDGCARGERPTCIPRGGGGLKRNWEHRGTDWRQLVAQSVITPVQAVSLTKKGCLGVMKEGGAKEFCLTQGNVRVGGLLRSFAVAILSKHRNNLEGDPVMGPDRRY